MHKRDKTKPRLLCGVIGCGLIAHYVVEMIDAVEGKWFSVHCRKHCPKHNDHKHCYGLKISPGKKKPSRWR